VSIRPADGWILRDRVATTGGIRSVKGNTKVTLSARRIRGEQHCFSLRSAARYRGASHLADKREFASGTPVYYRSRWTQAVQCNVVRWPRTRHLPHPQVFNCIPDCRPYSRPSSHSGSCIYLAVLGLSALACLGGSYSGLILLRLSGGTTVRVIAVAGLPRTGSGKFRWRLLQEQEDECLGP
jgi:hypothetical protein